MPVSSGKSGYGSRRVFAGVAALLLCAAACGEKPTDSIDATAGDLAGAAGGASPQPGMLGVNQPRAPQTSGSSAAALGIPANLDTSGWVLAPPFHAAGDEPFWRLEIADGWFVFKRSGLPEIEAPMVQPVKAGGADTFDSLPLKIAIKREVCSTLNGENGQASVIVSFDGIEYGGCGFAGETGASDSGVNAVIVEAISEIDACLDRLGQQALVTGIYAREGGRTALGLRTHIGSLYECAVESDGSTIAFLDPIEIAAANAWMTSRMRFLRSGAASRPNCEGVEDVTGGDAVLGWHVPASCRL